MSALLSRPWERVERFEKQYVNRHSRSDRRHDTGEIWALWRNKQGQVIGRVNLTLIDRIRNILSNDHH